MNRPVLKHCMNVSNRLRRSGQSFVSMYSPYSVNTGKVLYKYRKFSVLRKGENLRLTVCVSFVRHHETSASTHYCTPCMAGKEYERKPGGLIMQRNINIHIYKIFEVVFWCQPNLNVFTTVRFGVKASHFLVIIRRLFYILHLDLRDI
jgi:hypothetical protein